MLTDQLHMAAQKRERNPRDVVRPEWCTSCDASGDHEAVLVPGTHNNLHAVNGQLAQASAGGIRVSKIFNVLAEWGRSTAESGGLSAGR